MWLGIQELQLCPAAGGTGAYGRASHIPPMQGAGSSDSPISPLRPTSDCTPPHSVRADQPAGQELLKDGARVQSPRLGASWGLKGETSAKASSVQQRGLHGVPEEVLQVHRPAGEAATIYQVNNIRDCGQCQLRNSKHSICLKIVKSPKDSKRHTGI